MVRTKFNKKMVVEKDVRFSWLYLSVTVLMMFTAQAINGSSGIIVAILIDEFNETNARAGWVTSIVFFLIFVLCPLVIHTHQSLGFRWCMAFAGFFYLLSCLTTPFVPNLNYIYFTFSIPFGISISFLAQLSIRTQKEYFHKYYGLALGIRFGSIALGSAAMSFLLPMIYEELGFKKTFLSFLGFCPVFIIYGLVSRTHPDDTPNHSKKNGNIFEKLKIYREFFQDKAFVLCLAGTTTFFLTFLMPVVFIVRYGVTLGYPLSKAKWLLIVRNITTFPARLIVGHFSDIAFRRGKVKLMVQFCYPIFGLASVLCSFVDSFPMLMVYMGLSGVIEGVSWVTMSIYVDEITAGYHSDEAYALICFSASLTCLIGSPAIGWLFDVTGDFRYVFYTVFVVSLVAGFLVGISSCVKVKKEFSLIEKGRNRTVLLETCKLNVDDKLAEIYETSI